MCSDQMKEASLLFPWRFGCHSAHVLLRPSDHSCLEDGHQMTGDLSQRFGRYSAFLAHVLLRPSDHIHPEDDLQTDDLSQRSGCYLDFSAHVLLRPSDHIRLEEVILQTDDLSQRFDRFSALTYGLSYTNF